MITRTSLVHAAAHHGIFEASTPSDRHGAVLLATLSVNLNSEHDCRALLGLIARGEVTPVARAHGRCSTEQELQSELVGRGLPEAGARRLIQLSWLGDTSHVPDRWYYALLLPARTITADTLLAYPIRCMLGWLGDRTDPPAIHLREACSVALGEIPSATPHEQRCSREICAQWWNRYAGVTS